MAEDKNTIGLTEANRTTMEAVVEKGGFATAMDAAKFAFALALNRGCAPNPVEKAGTIWNIGTFDESGDLKALVRSLFPDVETPYRMIEALVNAGFEQLAREMNEASGMRIEEIIRKETEPIS